MRQTKFDLASDQEKDNCNITSEESFIVNCWCQKENLSDITQAKPICKTIDNISFRRITE